MNARLIKISLIDFNNENLKIEQVEENNKIGLTITTTLQNELKEEDLDFFYKKFRASALTILDVIDTMQKLDYLAYEIDANAKFLSKNLVGSSVNVQFSKNELKPRETSFDFKRFIGKNINNPDCQKFIKESSLIYNRHEFCFFQEGISFFIISEIISSISFHNDNLTGFNPYSGVPPFKFFDLNTNKDSIIYLLGIPNEQVNENRIIYYDYHEYCLNFEFKDDKIKVLHIQKGC